jgi:polar amino acid transport system substrate-binding protein
MNSRSIWLHCALAIGVTLGLSNAAHAQGFDFSGIEVNSELAARLPADIAAAGVLVGASDNAYPPWEYLAEDGQTPVGIDVDLGHAIAAKLGLTYESRTAEFATMLAALGTNYDIGINAMSITNERKKTANFVHYANSGSEWVVQAGNPTGFDPSNLCGTTIAIQPGTWYETQLLEANTACETAGKPAIEMLPFSDQTEAFTRVAVGGAAATIAGDATALYAIKQSGGAMEPVQPTGILGGTGKVGIPTPKAELALAELIADTLNDLIADGTYKAILDHWGVGTLGVETATVNPEVDI